MSLCFLSVPNINTAMSGWRLLAHDSTRLTEIVGGVPLDEAAIGVEQATRAKDGSFGFDFAGTYTRIITNELIEYSFGDRNAKVEFIQNPTDVKVRVSFDPESSHSLDQQREGWQAILNRFSQYVVAKC